MNEITQELMKAFFMFSFSLGVWTCLNLALSRRGDRLAKLLLIFYISALMMVPLHGYANLNWTVPPAWIQTLSQNLTWLYGPLAYLLTRTILLKPASKKYILFHLGPFLLICLDILVNTNLRYKLVFLTEILFAQIGIYLFMSMQLLFIKSEKTLALIRNHRNSSDYWLIFLIGSLFVATAIDVVIILLFRSGALLAFSKIILLGCALSIYVNAIALFSIYQPFDKTFRNNEQDNEAENQADPSTPPKLRNVELSPELAASLEEKLTKLVAEHKPHLDENISLEKLASLIGISRSQLSELLNVYKSTSFYQYLNHLRYEEALKLLDHPHSDYTVADIAYRSGFNNRNSFYKVFKEKTGVTPKEYMSKRSA